MPASLWGARASGDGAQGRNAFPRWIVAWFWLDAIIALAPPFYWAANGSTRPILGVPLALAYFLAVGLCITSSVVIAHLATSGTGEAP